MGRPASPTQLAFSVSGVTLRAFWGTFAVFVALGLVSGCGGRQTLDVPGAAGASDAAGTLGSAGFAGTAVAVGAAGAAAPTVGTIDLSQAPPTISMTCDNGVGVITFVNPCLVGWLIGAGGPTSTGPHEVECTSETTAGTVGWSFMVIFPPLQNPQPGVPLTPTAVAVDLGDGRQARISKVTGTLTFSRVDPTNRAFVAQLTGDVTWTEPSGATFQCQMDAPIWGGPGPFT